MREVKKEAMEERKSSRAKISALERDIEEQRKARAAEVEQDKKDKEQTLIDQSDMFKAKLVVEYEKFEKLQEENEQMKVSSVEKVKLLENSIEDKVKKIKEEFNVRLSVYEGEVKERERVNEEKVKSMEEILKQTEEDADKEILEMKTKYEKDLKVERESLVKVRGELGIMKKKNMNSLKELDSHKENIDWMGKEQVRFKIEIKTGEKDKIDLKREIRSRDSTILNKEKEITKLKNELRHMENTKYVFEHKIKTLQEEIKPKEDKMTSLKQQILDMEGELTSNVKNQSEITAQTEELKGKLNTALQDLTVERRKVHLAVAQNAKFLKEFELLQSVLQDPKKLKEGVLNLYNKVMFHPTIHVVRCNVSV